MKIYPLLQRFAKELEPFRSSPLFPLYGKINVLDADAIDFNSGKLDLSKVDASNTIAIGQALEFDKVTRLLHEGGIRHVVQWSRENFVFDIVISTIMLNKPSAFQANPQPFFTRQQEGLMDLARTTQWTEFTVKGSEDKSSLLKMARVFLNETPATAAVVQPAVTVLDEMIMNAVYDAPSEVRKLPNGAHEDRSQPVVLAPNEYARVFLSYDSKRLLIGCEDPFGSVNEEKLISRLHQLYSDPDNVSPIVGGPGAGLGCKVMIDYSCGFYMAVKKGQKTLVCCSMPLNVSIRKFESLPKHMHFCYF
jgi:hypothetical protein